MTRPRQRKKITCASYKSLLKKWLESLTSPETRRAYKKHAMAFIPYMEQLTGEKITSCAGSIRAMDVQDFCADGKTGSVIKMRTAVARGIFKTWASNGLVDHNPAILVNFKTRGDVNHTPPADPEKIRLCLNTLGKSKIDIRDRAIILLGVTMAFRRSEISGLTVDQLAFNGPNPVINVLGKGRKLAAMPCPPSVIAAIKKWLDAARISHGRVFINLTSLGKYKRIGLTGSAIYKIIRHRLGCSPHGMRAACLTEIARKTGDIEQAYIWARHTKRETTDIYVTADRFQEAKLHIPQW